MEKSIKSEQNAQSKNLEIYQEVTNKIIAMLENGVLPWRKSWNSYGLARNYLTGHIYRGVNMLLMNNTNHQIPYFLTFNQIRQLNGWLTKGAKAEKVIYFKTIIRDENGIEIDDQDANEKVLSNQPLNKVHYVRYYNVYNVADIKNVEFEFKDVELNQNEKNGICEGIIQNMPCRPEILRKNSSIAYYDSVSDYINMPNISQFESSDAYYTVLFHEIIHSTGHASRLGREEIVNQNKFGSIPYSKEELVAELGSSYLSALAQINNEKVIENSASYISGWLKVLKQDPKFIFKVASDAQKAVDFILNNLCL